MTSRLSSYNREPHIQSLLEEFKVSNDTPEAADELLSSLITAYERAIDNGVGPGAALRVTLDMVNQEFKKRAAPA